MKDPCTRKTLSSQTGRLLSGDLHIKTFQGSLNNPGLWVCFRYGKAAKQYLLTFCVYLSVGGPK